jgi:4-hydroxyphenylpyruvate dioxygenase
MRFVERCGLTEVFPGFEARPWTGPTNRFGLTGFDTVTSSFETMKPALLWMQHVLGFESYGDGPTDVLDSSSARTEVMWDRESGLKFANNEPCRPAFKTSQANEFAEQNRGDGIQRVALAVTDIVHTVKGLKAHGVEFMSTAHGDDEHLRERMEVAGLDAMDVDVSQLRDLGIRMDGDGTAQVTLQAFLKEASRHHRDPEAGPFFYEVIQTGADRGGDAAQVKAFLEAIERNQSMAKTA